MSVGLLLILIFFAALIFTIIFNAKRKRRAVEEPSCGACGYCVRGLETFTCPECGGDLREVGILTPGSINPTPRWMRVLFYTAIVPLPVFLLAEIASPTFTPYTTTMSQSRVVFSHAPQLHATVRIAQSGTRNYWGRGARQTPPPDTMRLTLESKNSPNVLTVTVPSGVCSFTDSDGAARIRPTPFDASTIEDWLRVHGFTADGVADLASDIKTAIDDMSNPRPPSPFLRFPNSAARRAIAHPTSPPFVVTQPRPLASLIPLGITALIWLIGLPFVLRRSTPSGAAQRSPGLPLPTS